MVKDPYPFDQIPQLALQQQQVMTDVKALHENEAFSLKNFTFQERSLLYAIFSQHKEENREYLKYFSIEEITESERWNPFVALLAEEVPLKHLITCHEEELKSSKEWGKWALYLIRKLQRAESILDDYATSATAVAAAAATNHDPENTVLDRNTKTASVPEKATP